MKDKNNISKEELNDFLSEVDKTQTITKTNTIIEKSKYTYRCPKCNKEIESRKDPCPYCNYKGYVPMSDVQIKKTRRIMFVIILAIAIILLIIRKTF